MLRKIRHWVRHVFVPHESNNWRAKSLHPLSLIGYISFILVVQGYFGWAMMRGPSILGYATNISVDRILQLVNGERAKEHLDPLVLNPSLSEAAQKKGQDMFAKNYWAHVSPSGTTPWYFITSAGYNYLYAGENLAKSFNSSDDVVTAWMKSPTHRANIMKPEYKEIGMAVLNGHLVGEETTLVVQEFGARTLGRQVAVAQNAPAPAEVPEQKPLIAEESPASLPEQNPVVVEEKPLPAIVQQPVVSTISWYSVPRKLSLVIAEIMLFVLCLDALYIWRHRMSRVSTQTIAHIIFFLALIGAMGAAGAGAVL